MRRIIGAVIAFVTAVSFAGCVPFYGVVRDAVRSPETQRSDLERKALQQVLGDRFRPELASTFPGADVGEVQCLRAPDMGGSSISRCEIAIGNQTIPILAQLNPTDDHLNAALGLAFFRRSVFEEHVSVQLYAAYGRRVKVSCDVPSTFIAPPGFHAACTAPATAGIGKHVSAFVLDTFGWTQAVGPYEPPDEANLLLAMRRDGHHVAGKLLAQIIARRQGAVAAALHSGDSYTGLHCGKTVNLGGGRTARCEVRFDGQEAVERVRFANGRLAFRIEGAIIGVPEIERYHANVLRRRFHAGKDARIVVDCGNQRRIVLTGLGYRWCEIQAPKGYPKRLVLAELDDDGHYDAFYSDYSQAAQDH